MRRPGPTAGEFQEQARASKIENLVRERNETITTAGVAGGMIGSGDNQRWRPDSQPAETMKSIQLAGGNAGQAYNYDASKGKFNLDGSINADAAKNTFSAELRDTVTSIKTGGPDEKAASAEFIANIDVNAVGSRGDYQDVVINSVDDQALKEAYLSASGDDKAKVEELIKTVSQQINDKLKTLNTGTDEYKELLQKYQKMKLNPTINKHVE
jgi:hypothetical protein